MASVEKRKPITKKGMAALNEELLHLKTKDRPSIIAAIAEAREHGDLKENAEYHAAKDKQGLIEARILMLENIQSHAQVIDPSTFTHASNEKILFGAIVTLENVDNQSIQTYQIVGEYEADINAQKISISSPIARALIGKCIDEEVEVNTPSGKHCYAINAIKYTE